MLISRVPLCQPNHLQDLYSIPRHFIAKKIVAAYGKSTGTGLKPCTRLRPSSIKPLHITLRLTIHP